MRRYLFAIVLSIVFVCCHNSSKPSDASEEEQTEEQEEQTEDDTEDNNEHSSNEDTEMSNIYDNYEETSNCCDGIVVYEGQSDYYIIETTMGYTILETYSGILSEGDNVRGELNTYGSEYLIDSNDNEINVYIEDYMLSKDRAIEWMGSHNHLKYIDQEEFEQDNEI